MGNNKSHHILELIRAKEWHKLKRTLRIGYFFHRLSVAKCSVPCSDSCKSTHSALHFACQYDPPLDVVKMLCKTYPEAVFEQDCKERYVLHIACRYGCSPPLISFLLKKNPDAAKKTDIENKTPFLTAFKSYVGKSNKEMNLAHQDLLQVAQDLYQAYPAASINEDCNKRTALDYAIDAEYPIELVLYVQSVIGRENKHSKRSIVTDEDIGKSISIDSYGLKMEISVEGGSICDCLKYLEYSVH